MILYLHGFQSSPSSFKSKTLTERMQQLGLSAQCLCPQLPESPQKAIALARQLASAYSPGSITLIGSSLGGYYATYLAEELGCRAVLLNPVVDPWKIKILLSEEQSEEIQNSSALHEWLRFIHDFGEELISMRVSKITPASRYFLLAAKGDWLLDWEQMCSHYQGAKQLVIEGGDHGFSDFPQYLDQVLSFCGVQTDNK